MTSNLPKGMNEYYGRNIDKIPELLKAGKVPMYAARLMQARLKQGDEFQDLWNYTGTSDLPIYPQSKKFGNDDVYTFLTVNNQGEIANEQARQALGLIVPGNLAGNHGAIVPDEMFEQWRDKGDKIGLIKIPRKKIITDTYLTKDKVLNELTWRVLARHPDEVPTEFVEDKALLGKYFDAVRSRTKQDKNMAIYIGDSLKDETTLKAWYIDGADRYDRSLALAGNVLDDRYGRLVDLAPEVLGAQNLQGSLVDNVNKQLESLEGIVKPENLTKIRKALNGFVSVEQVLEASRKYIPEVAQADFEKEVKQLYGKSQ